MPLRGSLQCGCCWRSAGIVYFARVASSRDIVRILSATVWRTAPGGGVQVHGGAIALSGRCGQQLDITELLARAWPGAVDGRDRPPVGHGLEQAVVPAKVNDGLIFDRHVPSQRAVIPTNMLDGLAVGLVRLPESSEGRM